MKRATRIAVASIVAAALAAGGAWAWRDAGRRVSTDDAYVGAQVVQVASQVAGRVLSVAATEGQTVRRGDVLFRLDPEPLELAVDAARARLTAARETAAADSASVGAARADAAAQAQTARNAAALAARDDALVAKGFLSPQAGETARTEAAATRESMRAAGARIAQAQAAAGAPGEANAGVRAAETALDQARLDLRHAVAVAPADGRIAQLNLRPGMIVAAGQPLFALVDSARYWVDANFKETELARIRPGQSARIALDMQPDRILHGSVESIGAGTGNAFSLLPPENASGNWVKVAQRVPVRIRIDRIDPASPPAIGASATATVDIAHDGAR
jgi:membrane fusion protein (multidrug efflux system)